MFCPVLVTFPASLWNLPCRFFSRQQKSTLFFCCSRFIFSCVFSCTDHFTRRSRTLLRLLFPLFFFFCTLCPRRSLATPLEGFVSFLRNRALFVCSVCSQKSTFLSVPAFFYSLREGPSFFHSPPPTNGPPFSFPSSFKSHQGTFLSPPTTPSAFPSPTSSLNAFSARSDLSNMLVDGWGLLYWSVMIFFPLKKAPPLSSGFSLQRLKAVPR